MKRIISVLLTFALLMALVGCAGSTTTTTAATTAATTKPAATTAGTTAGTTAATTAANVFDKKYTWSLGTTYSKGSAPVEAYNKFAELLGKYSNGTITLNVFTDGALGKEDDATMAVSSGDLEFTGSGTGPIYLLTPEWSFLMGVFLLEDFKAFTNVLRSDLYQNGALKLLQDKHNVRLLDSLGYRGYRNVGTNQRFTDVSGFKGTLFRMNSNQNWVGSWNSIGGICVSISLGELYTAIQNKTVYGSEGPWDQMTGISLQEITKYVMETRHTFEASGIWMSNKVYNELPDAYKQVVDKASKEAIAYMNEVGPQIEKAQLQKMLDAGCELVPIDRNSFVEAMKPFLQKSFETTWKVTTYEEVMKAAAGK